MHIKEHLLKYTKGHCRRQWDLTYLNTCLLVIVHCLMQALLQDVIYNLNNKVLFNPINGESNVLSDRDMNILTYNDITDGLDPGALKDKSGNHKVRPNRYMYMYMHMYMYMYMYM